MDHGIKYWLDLSYEQQKQDIFSEFNRLLEFWGKTPRNVKLFMNRCIKYTTYSIEDPKNHSHKPELERILEIEKEFKNNPEDLNLEKEIYAFFERKEEKTGSKNELLNLFEQALSEIYEDMPDPQISIVMYDENNVPLKVLTGTFESIFSSVARPERFYYRIAILEQNTERQRIKDKHFGVGTSCLGGLYFSLEESLNRMLNHMVQNYDKDPDQSFYAILRNFWLYAKLIEDSKSNTSECLCKEIDKLRTAYPGLAEITDLNLVKKKTGIYIMVLDKYNLMYVGQAKDIAGRIMRHWSRSDYFDGTGVDLFKAKDTTRIFVMECNPADLDEMEYALIDILNKKYLLNQMTGGSIDYHLAEGIPLAIDQQSEENLIAEIKKMNKIVEKLSKGFVAED
jgi:hypothetical protein